jgi:hypothetical protein
VVLNEKLLEVLGDDVTQEQAFAHANDVLKNAVGGISDIIHMPGLVNVDFEDVRTVMGEPGKAMMGTATAGGPDRATKAAEQAVACPLLEGIDLSGARGVLVLITAAHRHRQRTDPDPHAEQPADQRRQRHDACHARRDPDRLRQHGRAQRVAHQPHAGRGPRRCAVLQRHGRL